MKRYVLICAWAVGLAVTAVAEPSAMTSVPVLDGDWWRLTDDTPDVAPYTYRKEGKSKVCDFTIFKDAHQLWHLIACVRDTTAPGDRVFHHWTSKSLTSSNWTSAGNFEAPRGLRAGVPASQQAPHGFVHGGRYYLFYNSGGAARALVSPDGAQWKNASGGWNVLTNTGGNEKIFTMGRDVNLFHDTIRQRWLAYYCGTLPGGKQGAMMARTAPDLTGPWSEKEIPVRTDGNPESPFVLKYGDQYYLWQQMEVYVADTPESFSGLPIAHLTGIWFNGKWAPEVLEEAGQFYVAGYGDGIWLAKMKWVQKTPAEIDQWRKTDYAKLEAEREKRRAPAKPE